MPLSDEHKQKLREKALARFSNKKNHPRYGSKLSENHKKKLSEFAKTRTRERASNWKGGSFICDGYRYVQAPEHPNKTKEGYVCEHRLIVERSIGRLLSKEEIVHHINGDKLDNRLSNLIVCISTGKHFIEHHNKKRDSMGRFSSA